MVRTYIGSSNYDTTNDDVDNGSAPVALFEKIFDHCPVHVSTVGQIGLPIKTVRKFGKNLRAQVPVLPRPL